MKTVVALGQRRWITILATVGLAFLSGHLVQNGRGDASRVGELPGAVDLPSAPVMAQVLPRPPQMRGRVEETRSLRKGGCAPDFQVNTTPDHAIHLSLSAPCHLDAPLVVRVNELAATEMTDPQGRWKVRLPFLAKQMTVTLSFKDHVMTRVVTSQVPQRRHVVLASHGPETFRIRADIFESETGAAQDIDKGEFVRVGIDGGAAFQVFSLPHSEQPGVVRLSVDAKVTLENCGKAVSTVAYQSGYLGGLRPTEIAYRMPDCDRVGEVVRLQNLFRDMRLAAR